MYLVDGPNLICKRAEYSISGWITFCYYDSMSICVLHCLSCVPSLPLLVTTILRSNTVFLVASITSLAGALLEHPPFSHNLGEEKRTWTQNDEDLAVAVKIYMQMK